MACREEDVALETERGHREYGERAEEVTPVIVSKLVFRYFLVCFLLFVVCVLLEIILFSCNLFSQSFFFIFHLPFPISYSLYIHIPY